MTPPTPGTGPGPPAGVRSGRDDEALGTGIVTDLHDELHLRLPHRRLVILGESGAGKTAAMILRLLADLAHRG